MSTLIKRQSAQKTKLYPNYRVIMYNDDCHTFDFVIDLLSRTISNMTQSKAEAHAMEIHTAGASIVTVEPFEIAEFYCEVFSEGGMKASIEPDV